MLILKQINFPNYFFFFHGWVQCIVFQAYHINNIHNGKFLLKIWATHSGFSQSELRYLDKCFLVVRAGYLRKQVSLHQTILWVLKQVLFMYKQIDFFFFLIIWSTLAAPFGLAHTEVWRPYNVFIGVSVWKRVRYCMAPSVSPFKLL